MKVHFACSTSELEIYGKNYTDICNAIKLQGHTITRDWIDNALMTLKDYKKGKHKIDRVDIYNRSVESLLASDFVVIEGTISSFSIGHQLTLALSKNKPVLFMIYRDIKDGKNKLQASFVHGISSPLLKVSKYSSEEDIKDILKDFLNNNSSVATKFNIVLNKEIESYLDWASFYHKVNKSEFIRNLISKHMKEVDIKYKNYLNKNASGL